MGEHRLEIQVDESIVAAAMSALSGLTEAEQTAFMRAVVESVIAYRTTGKAEVLEQLAGDIEATVRLRQLPDYVSAVRAESAPASEAPRRSVREIFASARA
jgi:hypothetical protein